jgi:thiol-disulfide isomerase/thioredoxin
MTPDTMMPKAETASPPAPLQQERGAQEALASAPDAMQKDTMMDEKKMSDTMPLPYPSSGAVAPDTLERPADTMIKKESGYKTYTPELVASALASGQRVALFFHATWCPSCKALDRAITADSSSIPADILIVRVDYDTSTELKKKYGVVTQHTTVVLNSDGSAKSKKIGARTVAEVVGE